MYSGCWPFIGMVCFCFCSVKMYADMARLLLFSRRSRPRMRSQAAEWNTMMQCGVWLSIPVASLLFAYSTGQTEMWKKLFWATGAECDALEDSDGEPLERVGTNWGCLPSGAKRATVFILLEHIGAVVAWCIFRLIEPIPPKVQTELDNDKKLRLRRWQEASVPPAPPKLRADLKKAFKLADVNGDGRISRDEFGNLLHHLSSVGDLGELDDNSMDLLMDEMDMSGNGELTLTEALLGIMRLRSDVVIQRAFGLQDVVATPDEGDITRALTPTPEHAAHKRTPEQQQQQQQQQQRSKKSPRRRSKDKDRLSPLPEPAAPRPRRSSASDAGGAGDAAHARRVTIVSKDTAFHKAVIAARAVDWLKHGLSHANSSAAALRHRGGKQLRRHSSMHVGGFESMRGPAAARDLESGPVEGGDRLRRATSHGSMNSLGRSRSSSDPEGKVA